MSGAATIAIDASRRHAHSSVGPGDDCYLGRLVRQLGAKAGSAGAHSPNSSLETSLMSFDLVLGEAARLAEDVASLRICNEAVRLGLLLLDEQHELRERVLSRDAAARATVRRLCDVHASMVDGDARDGAWGLQIPPETAAAGPTRIGYLKGARGPATPRMLRGPSSRRRSVMMGRSAAANEFFPEIDVKGLLLGSSSAAGTSGAPAAAARSLRLAADRREGAAFADGRDAARRALYGSVEVNVNLDEVRAALAGLCRAC